MGPKYITKLAKGSAFNDFPHLREVLDACPDDYRLHSVVPLVTATDAAVLYVIFEALSAL